VHPLLSRRRPRGGGPQRVADETLHARNTCSGEQHARHTARRRYCCHHRHYDESYSTKLERHRTNSRHAGSRAGVVHPLCQNT
jgi:hypothetical protein